MSKLKVIVIFGGRSAEHHVSIQSAKNIVAAINKDKYDVRLIGIGPSGKWYLNDGHHILPDHQLPTVTDANYTTDAVAIARQGDHPIIDIDTNKVVDSADVVFPVLHGSNGEDGSVQGLLRIFNIPFVGPGILSSAICMDKEATKRMLLGSGIKVARHLVYDTNQHITYDDAIKELGLPFFIKPSSLGSSIGVHKVTNRREFEAGMDDALQFDIKILLEENITGREIECAVLGNTNPEASVPGEIIPNSDFYSYESKYIDENGAILQIPADLSPELTAKIQGLSKKIFKLLYCEGMARVDFFLTPSGEIILNEVNTIPGFTKISMYPKLWEISGLSYTALIDRLIELALERHSANSKLKFSY